MNESIDVATLVSLHRSMSSELIEMVTAAKSAHAHVPHNADEDTTAILVTSLFEDRVGEPVEDNRLKRLYVDGAKRYQLKTPPDTRTQISQNQ